MKFFRHFLVFLSFITFLLNPIPSLAFQPPSPIEDTIPRDPLGRINPWVLLQPENLSLDRYFAFIDLTDNEAFLSSLTEEEFDLVVNFVTHMVEASVPDSYDDLKKLYRSEIDELLEDLYGEPQWTFNDSFDFELVPALAFQDPDYLLCKSWMKRKAHHFGHWCKKHKKPLIIGAVVVGVITVAVLTGGVGGSSATAVGGALINDTLSDETSKEDSKPPPKTQPTFPKEEVTPILVSHANETKEELYQKLPDKPLNIPPSEEPTFWQKASETGRELIAQGAHDVYDFINTQIEPIVEIQNAAESFITNISPELGEKIAITTTPEAFKDHVAHGHEAIDRALQTDSASLYSDEAKKVKDKLTTGVLPPPGILGKNPTSKTLHHLTLSREQSIELFKNAATKLEPYQGKYLPESKARELIQSTNIPTFSRPKGIPENYRVKLSDKPGGIKYVHPNDEGTYIRIMPGKVHSKNPNQQKPYVVHRVNGKSIDKSGNIVSNKSTEAHIPIEEFTYREFKK
ncbi:MAG: hypothetical protein H7A41_07845 [Chlamydiales bacterium]|nr:hypothetical protein [Chlamydiales bacterium]